MADASPIRASHLEGAFRAWGRLVKTIGINGGIVAQCYDPFVFDQIPHAAGNFLFISIDGLAVPFAITAAEEHTDNSAVLYFEVRHDGITPAELVGAELLLPTAEFLAMEEDDEEEGMPLDLLIGCVLHDQAQRLVGEIVDYEQYSYSTLLVVERPSGEEVLVPIHPDLIEALPSEESPVLQLQIAEGLLSEE